MNYNDVVDAQYRDIKDTEVKETEVVTETTDEPEQQEDQATDNPNEEVKRINRLIDGEPDIKSTEEYDELAGQVNLLAEVEELFKKYDYDTKGDFSKGRLKEDLLDQPFSIQRLWVNRILRLILGYLENNGDDTRELRYVLLDSGSIEEWRSPLPEVIKYIANRFNKLEGKAPTTNEEVKEDPIKEEVGEETTTDDSSVKEESSDDEDLKEV